MYREVVALNKQLVTPSGPGSTEWQRVASDTVVTALACFQHSEPPSFFITGGNSYNSNGGRYITILTRMFDTLRHHAKQHILLKVHLALAKADAFIDLNWNVNSL